MSISLTLLTVRAGLEPRRSRFEAPRGDWPARRAGPECGRGNGNQQLEEPDDRVSDRTIEVESLTLLVMSQDSSSAPNRPTATPGPAIPMRCPTTSLT